MKRLLFIPIFVYLFVVEVFSQTVSLRGSIIDAESGENLPFASVVLFKKDSVYFSGTTSDVVGEFLISNLTTERYRIKISFVGYETFEIVKDILSDTNLGKIKLKMETLTKKSTFIRRD